MVASVGVVSIRGLSEHGDGLARTVYDLDTVARRTTQASFTPALHPSAIANQVPASAGVKAGMSPLSGGR